MKCFWVLSTWTQLDLKLERGYFVLFFLEMGVYLDK